LCECYFENHFLEIRSKKLVSSFGREEVRS
jgi:hypothetical protein